MQDEVRASRFAVDPKTKALSMTDNYHLWFRFSIPLGSVPFLFSSKIRGRQEKEKERKRKEYMDPPNPQQY